VDLVDALLSTRALRLAPPGEVFWYTSGTLGPYYINTHYLFGGEAAATVLLDFIEAQRGAGARFHAALAQRAARQYDADPVYRAVVDQLTAAVRTACQPLPDLVSGGERRDWFFSTAVALCLQRPHLLLRKDLGWSVAAPDGGAPGQVELAGARVVHVADLVTEASSYTRAWIPALAAARARLVLSANVVDRGQGGLQVIRAAGVSAEALVCVDRALFDRLLARGLVGEDQHRLLCGYWEDPQGSMRAFLMAHPGFLRAALASQDARTAARARLLVEKNPYGLPPELLA